MTLLTYIDEYFLSLMKFSKKRIFVVASFLFGLLWIFHTDKKVSKNNSNSKATFYYLPNDTHCPSAIFETIKTETLKVVDKCQNNPKDWLVVFNNYAVFDQESVKSFGPFLCLFKIVSWRSDFESDISDTWHHLINNTYLGSKTLYVRCKGWSLFRYHEQYLFGFENRKIRSISDHLKDVLIVGIDSVSRAAWKRLLPESYKYIEQKMSNSSSIFKKVNVLGDGTTVNVFGILAGELEMDVYESRKGFPGAMTVDEYPWIWKAMRPYNYATFYDDDDIDFGIFQYRLLGFKKQPTDFYGRSWRMALGLRKYSSLCINRRNLFQDQLKSVREFFQTATSHKFAFLWSSKFSHDYNEDATVLDSSLLDLLKEVNRPDGIFNNTIFILMSDHGHRFNSRLHLQGKFEERLPFLAINLPPSLLKERPHIFNDMESNANKLVTFMDVNQSIRDMISNFQNSDDNKTLYRRSLFDRNLPLRSCEDVKIATHWCSCLKWVELKSDQMVVQDAARYAVSVINDFIKDFRLMCYHLRLEKILRAHLVAPSKDVLTFRDSDGHGRVPNMLDDTRVDVVYYRISFKTQPGDAIFETTVSVRTGNMRQEYGVSIGDIDRSNKYADWIWCVKATMKDIRKFCLCK